MEKVSVRKGEEVVVISGAEKGKRGRVIAVLAKHGRVVVEGVHMIKRHQRKGPRSAQGGILEREGSVHHSNLMVSSRYDARLSKRQTAGG